MAATSTRTITTTYSGDVTLTQSHAAASNGASPATEQIMNLASGNNQILPPGGGTTLSGVTLVPPVGNAVGLTLKGLAADTGIPIHLTDPTSLGLTTGVTMINLGAANAVTGLRLFWT